MFIAKGLLVKGVVASATLVTASLGAVYNKEISNFIFGDKTIEKLGLPESCKFTGDESNNTKECTLTKDQLKAVKFKNIEGNQVTVTGLDSETITLEIKKFNTPTEEEKNRYKTDLSPNDLWFTFKNLTKDVTIKKSENDTENQIKLIKGTNPEFKINNDKLEKAWTVTTLGEKVGLTCPASTGDGNSDKKCTIGASKTIKIYEDASTSKDFTSATTATENQITYEVDTQDYNQGFKFSVSSEISGSDASVKLATGDYEIKYEESKGWHLAKKST